MMRIRVGVHAGMAYARDGDYVALALHQAARVVSAANGGQVIASEDAAAAAGDSPAVRFQPIGTFRLRDFEGPVRLAAVRALDEEVDELVSVRAVPADGHNLMAPTTSFVGRAGDVADLAGRLGAGRVVTMVGPGGMGKTRLAVEVRLQVAPEWPDGVAGGPLHRGRRATGGGGGEPGRRRLAGRRRRRARDRPWTSCRPPGARDLRQLRARPARCGELVGRLVSRGAKVGVLATSRVPLALPSEEQWRIEPLEVEADAVRLFVERGRSRVPDFTMSAADEATVPEICRRLDGMPLAIELAAARLSVLSPAEILEGLRERFRLLRTNDPTAAPRQRSLRALLDWGAALLTPDEQLVFARLSVFWAAFDLDAAAGAAGFDSVDSDDVADLVWSLADGSFLVVDRTEGHTRYRMLETIRAYAADRLDDSGDGAATRQRLAEHYLTRYPWREVVRHAPSSPLSMEADTVSALVDGLFDDGRDDDALALARILAVVHHAGGRLVLALDELEHAIDRARNDTAMLARAHVAAHGAASALGRTDIAETHVEQARRLVAKRGQSDRWGHVSLARAESEIALQRGSRVDMARAAEHLRVELADDRLSDLDRAFLLNSLGQVEGDLGEADAVPVLEEAVELLRRSPPDALLSITLCSLAEQELRAGTDTAAARHQRESMYLAVEGGNLINVAHAYVLAARLAERLGHDEAATRLHGAADVLYEDAGFQLMAGDQRFSDAMRDRIRLHLGPERADTLTREGRALDGQAAMALAEEVFGRFGS
jgi:predicted ATPase